MIPKATTEIPQEITELIALTGQAWKKFNRNNLFDKNVLHYWNQLINDWAEDSSLPLVIRNARAVRGGVTEHNSGREIIFCDNSPAKWVAEKVFMKEKPTLKDIKSYLKKDQIPFKFLASKGEQEKAKYKCISKNDFNKAGWKLCHAESVGLKKLNEIEGRDIEFLKMKFILLLNPKNFFILPKTIGGLGEIKWFIESQQ